MKYLVVPSLWVVALASLARAGQLSQYGKVVALNEQNALIDDGRNNEPIGKEDPPAPGSNLELQKESNEDSVFSESEEINTFNEDDKEENGNDLSAEGCFVKRICQNTLVCNRNFGYCGNNLLLSSPKLKPNNLLRVMTTSRDYRLSFYITPRGIVNNWGSILHFTNGDNCCNHGSRAPGIWFGVGDTKLHVVVSQIGGLWEGIVTSDPLPLNVRTRVTVECRGSNVRVIVGGRQYNAVSQPGNRFTGTVKVYAGDPWWPAANAVIERLCYEPIRLDDATSQEIGEETSEQ